MMFLLIVLSVEYFNTENRATVPVPHTGKILCIVTNSAFWFTSQPLMSLVNMSQTLSIWSFLMEQLKQVFEPDSLR